jgi:hypothetical protein
MATQGRGGLARLARGSVAAGVLQRTSLPLLLTQATAAQQVASAAPSQVEAGAEPGNELAEPQALPPDVQVGQPTVPRLR